MKLGLKEMKLGLRGNETRMKGVMKLGLKGNETRIKGK